MAEERTQEPNAVTWPYTSFRTVLNVLDKFKGAVPPRIDRSALGGSEGQKTQVLAALKFFGLIKPGGEVTPIFQELVNNEKDRGRVIKGLLETHYGEAVRLGTINGTTNQLAETFKGLAGDTLRKAMTFYLHAAKFAGVAVSKNFKVPTGFARRGARRANNGTEDDGAAGGGDAENAMQDARNRYVEFLMKRAEAMEDPEASERLYDRIERILLGSAPEA